VTANIIIQYVGFEVRALGREYFFHVREVLGESREFILTIPNEAFNSHRVRLQDAPDLCSLKLRRELALIASHPAVTRFKVSDSELDEYRFSHSRKTAKR